MLRVVPAFSHSLPAAGTRTHTPSPVHKGSLSCSAQPCNVCKRRELPYSHSPNRLLSPSWPGSCSHSCFNPWEQRHDSKQLFAHWSGLPPATSSSFSPPFFLVCWVRIFFFFNVFFLNPGGDRDTPSSHLCLPVPLSKKQQGRAPSSSADLQFPGLPFCSVALGERKRVKEGGRASRREGGSVQTGRRRRPTGCGRKEPECG